MDLVNIIRNNEKKIRQYYSKNFDEIRSWDFIEMILLDAVFIIEFLKESNDVDGPKNLEPWMMSDIKEDLKLLENQLPFFIIQEIYDEVISARQEFPSIPFLHLAAFHLGKEEFPEVRRHARKAGVRFRVAEEKCLLNIRFEKGVLEIPRLEVDYSFERFVRNIMALEQCYKPFEAYICHYIKFMDSLINSAEDVDLLVEKGIILHWLGDNAALSNMFNKLNDNIGETSTSYGYMCKMMNGHYENHWNRLKATLELVYFANVWRGTATVAAAILLVLTLIQAITSVKSVF
ncbi:UPF0481 protein At3g47200-like [Populus alba]|uniref:UPF0481 protein At3g47200-like n=1 Tax=Populus alba TaxID=43335 RepID=UPI001588FB61|nr:UPF0481 protein At3g47200-like [Populus alba]